MGRILLVTGGQRSGKSAYAEGLALRLSPTPVYVATARVLDEDFALRVQRHRDRRGPEWTTMEEPLWLSRLDVRGRVVLVDSLTLWAANFLEGGSEAGVSPKGMPEVETALEAMKHELSLFTQQEATFIFVTDETGMGGISPNPLQRHFTDLLGLLNQHVAAMAEEVVLVVSGIPVCIKKS